MDLSIAKKHIINYFLKDLRIFKLEVIIIILSNIYGKRYVIYDIYGVYVINNIYGENFPIGLLKKNPGSVTSAIAQMSINGNNIQDYAPCFQT